MFTLWREAYRNALNEQDWRKLAEAVSAAERAIATRL